MRTRVARRICKLRDFPCARQSDACQKEYPHRSEAGFRTRGTNIKKIQSLPERVARRYGEKRKRRIGNKPRGKCIRIAPRTGFRAREERVLFEERVEAFQAFFNKRGRIPAVAVLFGPVAQAAFHEHEDVQHSVDNGRETHVAAAIARTDFFVGKRVEADGFRQGAPARFPPTRLLSARIPLARFTRGVRDGHQIPMPAPVRRIERNHLPEYRAALHFRKVPRER